ncbi:MAG: hypothetical protein KatS3mg028_0862 [Bacteroidia bacterium]|nr:MAG: hypothetical protein KatS3mg028_0862 [Bacteroidia bacterium]
MLDKKENELHILRQRQKIIQDALLEKPEIRMADIAKMLKDEKGQTLKVRDVEDIVKQIPEIEIIKIGRAKGIRKKGTIGTLFNQ